LLCIHRRRPDFEVLLAPPWSPDGEAERYRPHVPVQADEQAGLLPALEAGVVCHVRVLKKPNRIDATIELNGTTSKVKGVCLEDLLKALGDRAVVLRERWRGGPTLSLRAGPSRR
jgi:hypothetical protein